MAGLDNPPPVHVENVTKHDQLDPEALGGQNLGRTRYKSSQFIGTVVATCLAQMSGYLSFNVPANILAQIKVDLNGSNDITWVAVVWTLGFAVGLPLVGRLSDIFGRRWFYIGATGLTLVGSIVAARAQTVPELIGGTSIIGISAAGQLSFNVVLGELVAMKDRGPFNALVLATSTPFSIFAPAVARSFMLDTAEKWRWIYYLGIIINAVALGLWYWYYHPPNYEMLHVRGRSRLALLKTLDWIGIVLFTGGLAVFLIGLNWGGTTYPWDSAPVLATLLVGLATLAVFCVWEVFCPGETVYIPMKLFRDVPYDALVVCASVGAMIYYSMLVLWPTLVTALWVTDERQVGWYSCVVGAGLITGQVCGGIGHKYIPRTRIQMVVSTTLMVTFVGALASVNADALQRSCAFIALGALGAGYVESLSLSSIALMWDASDFGLVACVMGCIRTAAGAIATSLYSSVLASEVGKHLPRYVSSAVLPEGLPAASLPQLLTALTTGNFSLVPDITPTIIDTAVAASKRAWARSFKTVFLVTLAFGGIMFIAAFLSPDVEIYLTDEVPRALHERKRGEPAREKSAPAELAEGNNWSSSAEITHAKDKHTTKSSTTTN